MNVKYLTAIKYFAFTDDDLIQDFLLKDKCMKITDKVFNDP